MPLHVMSEGEKVARVRGLVNLREYWGQILHLRSSESGSASSPRRPLSDLTETKCHECGRPALAWPDDLEGALCCECARRRAFDASMSEDLQERLEKAGLTEGEPAHMTLESFDTRRKPQRYAYQACYRWVVAWLAYLDNGRRGRFIESLYLWSGGPGTGKTHLARAIQRAIITHGGRATFCSVPALLTEIRDSYGSTEVSSLDIMARLEGSQLLILDDLAREYVPDRSAEWFQDIMFQLVDHRYMAGAPVVITSNLAPEGLPALLGQYTASRLGEMVRGYVCEMTGPDWRLR